MPIPKTIHYAWLSGEPWAPVYKDCFASWEKVLGDYNLVAWDASAAPDSAFYRKMLRQKKWAFASDYLRLYALYHHGGIYLDLDVEVIKSFDPLLGNACFFGREDAHMLGCHVIGTQKGHPFIKECLNFYDNSHRLKISSPPTMPRIVTKLVRKYGLASGDTQQRLGQDITIYPSAFFTPLHYRNRMDKNPRSYIKPESYCLHHWQHGWSWLNQKGMLNRLRNQPWLFMNLEDWRRFIKNLLPSE